MTTSDVERRAPLSLHAVGLFVVPFITYCWFFGGGGWNQNAHFDLTRALVERQTFHIDGYRVNSGDIAWSSASGQWHAFSNKPPGLPFLAAIPYAAIYGIERALHLPVDDWFWMTVNLYLLTIVVCATAGAGIAVLLFRWAHDRASASHAVAVLVALLGAFGTIVFGYSTVFFSLVPAAFFLLLAFCIMDERPLLAGLAAGVAGMCYYPCILAAAIFAAGVGIRSRRNALWFIAGGVPSGALLAVYHTVCFGAPWRTAVEVAQNFSDQRGLFLGLFRHVPAPDALWGLTFSEYRGLFFVSPVLLLAFVGAAVMVRRRLQREAIMIGASATIVLLLVASFAGWEGGSSFGPRHILPVVPLLVLPVAFLRGRVLLGGVAVLTVVSVAINLLAAIIDVSPAGGIRHPVRDFYLPVITRGRIPPGTLEVMGRTDGEVGYVSINRQTVDELIPHAIHRPGSRQSEWASFNLGELVFGTGTRASVLPIVLWMVVGSTVLLRNAGR